MLKDTTDSVKLPSAKQTRADAIVFRLTQDIVSHRLAPGTLLDESRLGREFGASRTPIREALRQLAASGLVELRAHRSPIVAQPDDMRLSEMFDAMAELEALCVARASVMMSIAQRQALEIHHQAMARHVRDRDIAAYRADNVVFHTLIYDGARNGYLKELALRTREQIAPHRGIQLEAPSRLAQSYAEHGLIVTAILRGDRDTAALEMRRHLALTREALDRLGQPARE